MKQGTETLDQATEAQKNQRNGKVCRSHVLSENEISSVSSLLFCLLFCRPLVRADHHLTFSWFSFHTFSIFLSGKLIPYIRCRVSLSVSPSQFVAE
jgi:hypothetical protein